MTISEIIKTYSSLSKPPTGAM